MTPTNVNHNPTTGVMTVTVVGHGMENGEYIKIDDYGILLNMCIWMIIRLLMLILVLLILLQDHG